MTPAQDAHLVAVTSRSVRDIETKYEAGQREHGGNLWAKGLHRLIGPQLRAEALDQLVYTDVLCQNLDEIRRLATDGLNSPELSATPRRALQRILEILDGTEPGT